MGAGFFTEDGSMGDINLVSPDCKFSSQKSSVGSQGT